MQLVSYEVPEGEDVWLSWLALLFVIKDEGVHLLLDVVPLGDLSWRLQPKPPNDELEPYLTDFFADQEQRHDFQEVQPGDETVIAECCEQAT